MGWLCAATATVLIAYFAIDRSLELPAPIRMILSLATAIFLLLIIRRQLLYPLSRNFHRDDIATALEKRFPDLQEKLISAVQFGELIDSQSAEDSSPLRNQSTAMIAKVIEDASTAVRDVPRSQLLDPSLTMRVWGTAIGAAIIIVIGFISNPGASSIFLLRLLGADAAYPHLTSLIVELPQSSEYKIVQNGRHVDLTMAAGADLPVLVRVEGVVPREAFLNLKGGRGLPPQIAMTERPGNRFKHVFRRVTTPMNFHASGGDDPQGNFEISVHTVQPPRVGAIRATLIYPEYTGLKEQTQFGGSIEALEGSRITLHVTPTSAIATAGINFLDSGTKIELKETRIEEEGEERTFFVGDFTALKTDRYHVHLASPQGLKNPHPGTYPVVVGADHAPIGRVLLPSADLFNVVLPGGRLPLRVEARDDYGLAAVDIIMQLSRSDETRRSSLIPASSTTRIPSTVLTQILKVGDLNIGGSKPAIGDTISLSCEIRDNKKPEAMQTKLAPRQIHVIGIGDMARRIAGHFRRLRETTEKAQGVQQKRHDRLLEINDKLDSGSELTNVLSGLTYVEVGQARVQQDTTNHIHLELMRSYNVHLFNGLETSPHAARVIELYESFHTAHTEARGFLPEFYEMLQAEQNAGRLGSMPKILDPILTMIGSAARISRILCPLTIKLLQTASVERDTATAKANLEEAAASQKAILAEFAALLKRMDEWNDFQDVISQTRTLRDKQRDVQSRTKDALKGDRK